MVNLARFSHLGAAMSDENPRMLLEMKDALVRLGQLMLNEGPQGLVLFEQAVRDVRGEPLALVAWQPDDDDGTLPLARVRARRRVS